jgi:hypothetical protein
MKGDAQQFHVHCRIPSAANVWCAPHSDKGSIRGVIQEVEHLLCKHEALSLNPNPTTINNNDNNYGTLHEHAGKINIYQ